MPIIGLRTLVDAIGGPVPAGAVLTATASASRTSGDVVVGNRQITVQFVDGEPAEPVVIDPSGVDWYWHVRVVFRDAPRVDRFVVVPDVAEVEWADLVDVDPATMQPDPGAVPAWTAAVGQVAEILADTVVARDAAGGFASDAAGSAGEADGFAQAAQAAAGVAVQAKEDSVAASGTSVTAAATATTKAGEAASSATTAGTKASEAAASAATALAGQFRGASASTTDLNLITTPGIYYQATGANATLGRNYPVAGRVGLLEVFWPHGAADSAITQRYTFTWDGSGGRGIFMRVKHGSGSTWQPWRFIPSQRVDQTAGRAIYTWDDLNNREQLIYGDTGWRDITSLLINGWTATSVTVRRRNSLIELRAKNLSAAAASSAIFLSNTFLVGWDGLIDASSIQLTNAGQIRRLVNGTNTAFDSYLPSDTFSRLNAAYLTNSVWPTTLPGTAVGSIPA